MGWILDLFNGINLAPELVTKLNDIEAELSVLQSENVVLKIQTENLKKQIADVEREKQQLQAETYKTKELTHTSLLSKEKENILHTLGRFGAMSVYYMLSFIKMGQDETIALVKELKEEGYIDISPTTGTESRKCSITALGRLYLYENLLL
jgi:regulator of replication initiation timing